VLLKPGAAQWRFGRSNESLDAAQGQLFDAKVAQLAPSTGKTHRAYVWVYRSALTPAVVFDYCTSRAGEHARHFLQDWSGTLLSADFSGYKALYAQGRVVESGCWAHARRRHGRAARRPHRPPDVTWHVAARRNLIQKLPDGAGKAIAQQIERAKARVRARVEHIFHVIKNRFGFKKARWRGLAKNAQLTEENGRTSDRTDANRRRSSLDHQIWLTHRIVQRVL